MLEKLKLKLLSSILICYFKRHQYLRLNGLVLAKFENVFSPKYTVATRLILNYLSKHVPERRVTADVGTGCGVIGLYYAKERRGFIILTDISINAIRNAKENARSNKLTSLVDLVVADTLMPFRRNSIGLVLSNPPFLPIKINERNITIAAGENLETLRKLILTANQALKRGGLIVFTISTLSGIEEVKEILARNNLKFSIKTCRRGLFDRICLIEAVKQ